MTSKSRSRNCWAKYRGDCSNDISDEHLLSKALFPDKIVYVSGFDWCEGEQKQIGINSLVRKILCVKHNNLLSDSDNEAVKALDLFRYESTGSAERQSNQGRIINGIFLEKWLVKTAINFSIGGNRHIGVGMNDSEVGHPSPYLLAVAFGDLNLSHGMGAYFLYPTGYYPYIPGEIIVMPIIKDDYIGGFYFGLRGQPVFLNLIPGTSPNVFNSSVTPSLMPNSCNN